MTPTYYAIQYKPTGAFLPNRHTWKDSLERGFTHDEPTFDRPPRLFTDPVSANKALRAWLKGKWEGGRYYESPTPIPVPSRVASDMEVVPVRVMI
jgi:hypothetical protein